MQGRSTALSCASPAESPGKASGMDGKGAGEAAGCCTDMADSIGAEGAGAGVAAAALLKLKAPPLVPANA